MRKIETYIIDSFTDEPFKGNPAGVCLMTSDLSVNEMQLIAKELGLSETAFVNKINDGVGFSIRYFSPKMEIPLCGHATLAASKVIFEKEKQKESIRFLNIHGLQLDIQKNGEYIIMEFPIYETEKQAAPNKLLSALGLKKVVNSEYNNETRILLLEIENALELRILSPDFEQLKKSHDSINGVLVTSKSQQPDYDFESRYFWPWSGTNEDPVTGGTHTFLAKYWSRKLGKKKMNSFQCSERTGFMEVELISEEKMTIKSKAQIILRGELELSSDK